MLHEYVEDLRVRRNFVVALLRCLTRLGHWRQHRGEEPMHAYYTEFDWLPEEEIEEILPEDGMPASLVVHDLFTLYGHHSSSSSTRFGNPSAR